MNWLVPFVICVNILAIQARRRHGNYNIRNLIDFIRRRQFDTGRYGAPVLGVPRRPEHLPPSQPVYPGHSLIRPAKGHLKSSIKYPLRDVKNTLVYGNPSNIGIMYGKENERLQYSNFRRDTKTDKILETLVQVLKNHKRNKNKPPPATIIRESSEENDAREVLDIMDSDRMNYNRYDFRKASKSKYRKRSNEDGGDKDSDDKSSGQSATEEKNPGNPFTIHKNRYKQNYMWNHFMDGDHMNINPLGPEFKNFGPSGFDLFLGRKWWYFNQDDYKPMN